MINYIDFLSPPITLYHLERRTHTSKIGGFLVIIMLSLIISYISFLFYDLFSHKNMISIFHKKYQFEAGYYSFNSSSIFNFLQIFSPENGGYFDKYDSKYIRIYTTYAHSNFSDDSNLELYDHWVFDTCQNNDIKDLDPSLFSNIVNFTNSACIRYYYNSTEKKYYSLGDKNFFWPYLEHGISQKNNIYLTINVEKCNNISFLKGLLGECQSQKEIDEYLNKYLEIYLYFSDIQVDPTNYEYPFQKYLQLISTRIGNNKYYEENFIYYSPLKIRTKEGTFFGKIKDISSFYYDYYRTDIINNNNNYFTLTKYYHFMQNNVQIYERIYNNIFDLFSEIGGVIQFIFYIFFWTNFIYNKYIIAYDTFAMFFSVQNDKDKNIDNIIFKKKKIIKYEKLYNYNKINKDSLQNITNKKMHNFMKYIRNNTNNNYTNLTKSKTELKISEIESKNHNNKKLNIKTELLSKDKYSNFFKKINKKLDPIIDLNKFSIDHNSSNANLKENNILINIIKNDNNKTTLNNKKHLSNKEYINRMTLSKKSLGKIEHNNLKFQENIKKEKIKTSRHFSFIDFLKSFCFKDNKGSHNFLIIFRQHLLSEEHLFKNHIKMILLEKHNKCNTELYTNILESYNEL